MKGEFDYVITSSRGKFTDSLKGLWNHRDLLLLFVQRDFKVVYKQTILGPIWLVINPLFSSIVQAFVFGGLAGLSTDGMPMMLFYMAGNIVWDLFSKTATVTSGTFINNSHILGKVYFPRLIVPFSEGISTLLKNLIQGILILVFLTYYLLFSTGIHVSWLILLLPILFVQSMILGLGVGLCVSALTTKYKDLVLATGLMLQLWMYVSPVVYPLSTANGIFRIALLINPMTAIIENFRFCLMGSGQFLIGAWGISLAMTLAIWSLGVFLFSKAERTFIDTI